MLLQLSKYDHTVNHKQIYLNGYAVYKDQCFFEGQLSYEQQLSLIELTLSVIKGKVLATEISGSFSIVLKTIDKIIIITDRIGSRRIFYYKDNNQFICSNDFFELYKNIRQKNITLTKDLVALSEIFCFLYAFNDRTIFNEIKEINSSTCFQYGPKDIMQWRYWRWRETQDSSNYIDSLKKAEKGISKVQEELNLILNVSAKDPFLTFSGGGDSRLVMSLLKELNNENITSIILGQLASHDVRTAFKIAKELKTKIQYSNITDYSELLNLIRYEENLLKHSQGSNIVGGITLSLLQAKISFNNGIHLNGHMGDFLGGSHISLKEWLMHIKGNYNSSEFIYRVFQKHSIFRIEGLNDEIYKSIKDDLLIFFSQHPAKNNLDIIESFDLEHRQKKYIINDNQSFNSLGLTPSVILGQKDFIETFSQMNNSYRYGSRLYNHLKFNKFQNLGHPFTLYFGDSNKGPVLPKKYLLVQMSNDLISILIKKMKSQFPSLKSNDTPSPLDGKNYFYGNDNFFEIREKEYLQELKEVSDGIFDEIEFKNIKIYGILTLVIPQLQYLRSL